MVAPALDVVERVSYISSTGKGKDDAYLGVKTPGADDVEGGALRAGGTPNVWGRDYIGLLIQYAAVGMIYGTLPSTVYPLLQQYLNMEGTQILSASVLLNLPWSFKVFYGILSDCFPIFGYRRRPFMIIGWAVCAVMLLIMACSKVGKPYYLDRSLMEKDPSTYTKEDLQFINEAAQDRGSKYIVLMMLAAVGYVASDVAADGVVVELAQREPADIRGRTQTTIYMVRTIFMMISNAIVAFFFNGKDYGGDFSFSLSFPQLMIILVCVCVPTIPATWIFIKEEKHPGVDFKAYMSEFWELLQSRAMYQVIFYKFASGICESLSVTCSSPIQAYWVKISPLNSNVAAILGNLVFALTLYLTGKIGLHWNWRWMHAITLFFTYGIDAITTMLTTWDVIRYQWFWLGPPLLENLPYGMSFIIATYVVVELAGEGNEGAVYGLLTTVTNLTQTFASTITKNIDRNFDVKSKDIQADTHHVRTHVTYVYLIMYIGGFIGLLFLPLLPSQKKQTQELKAKGGKSKLIGGFTVFYLLFSLCWSVMVNIMSIYPSTSCYKFVGGDGC